MVGIPMLEQFYSSLWRGGEPENKAAWIYLRDSLNIKRVIQLDPNSEGSGSIARQLGFDVRYHPISWAQQVFVGPNDKDFRLAIQEIHDSDVPVFVHCLHGKDRTGLAVGCYRIWYELWKKCLAKKEMDNHGFHSILIGLSIYWANQTEGQAA